LWVVATEALDDPRRIEPVREAVQLGVDVLSFYRLALNQATNRVSRSILAELCALQGRQLSVLMARYCLAPSVLELSAAQREVLSRELFRGIDFMTPAGRVEMYRRALALERRCIASGERRALRLPRGAERQLYWRLADDAAERAGLLEAEIGFLAAQAAREVDLGRVGAADPIDAVGHVLWDGEEREVAKSLVTMSYGASGVIDERVEVLVGGLPDAEEWP
jgi:hypothetical protein